MEFFTPGHLIVIAIVALVLFFGWKNLPEMARSVGRSLRVFKTEIKGMSADDEARKNADEHHHDGTSPAAEMPRAQLLPRDPAAAEPAAVEAAQPTAPVASPHNVAARPRPRPTPGRTPAQHTTTSAR